MSTTLCAGPVPHPRCSPQAHRSADPQRAGRCASPVPAGPTGTRATRTPRPRRGPDPVSMCTTSPANLPRTSSRPRVRSRQATHVQNLRQDRCPAVSSRYFSLTSRSYGGHSVHSRCAARLPLRRRPPGAARPRGRTDQQYQSPPTADGRNGLSLMAEPHTHRATGRAHTPVTDTRRAATGLGGAAVLGTVLVGTAFAGTPAEAAPAAPAPAPATQTAPAAPS